MQLARLFCASIVLLSLGAGPATQPTSRPAQRIVTLREDAPEPVRRLWEHRDDGRVELVKLMRQEVKDQRADLAACRRAKIVQGSNRRMPRNQRMQYVSFHSVDDKRQAIQVAQERVDTAERGLEYAMHYPVLYPESSKSKDVGIGWIGFLANATVRQVIDDDSVIVHTLIDGEFRRSFIDVWIDGVDTSGLIDDATYEHQSIVWITGTETYDAVLGTNTIFRAEPFVLEDWLVGLE